MQCTVHQYYQTDRCDGKEYAILGNPNLGEVRIFFWVLKTGIATMPVQKYGLMNFDLGDWMKMADGPPLGRVDFKLADLGTLYVSGSAGAQGFGTIEQRVNERSREDFTQFDVATNLELGKLLPAKAGMSIPVYASFHKQ